jgi:Transposase DDE domain
MPQAGTVRKPLGTRDGKLAVEAGSDGEVGLAEAVRQWTEAQLRPQGFALPLIKRISLVVVGLLQAKSARRGDLVMALDQLKVSSARPESLARRVARTLNDPRLDPERILPYILGPHLPTLLSDLIDEHTRSQASDPQHQQRFPLLRVVVDESTKLAQVHILVAGLAYQGIVIPLAIRVWPQNRSLAPEDYRTHLASLLSSVEAILPPVLRQHILLLADRAYGRPDFIDLIEALGWSWLLRIQGQTQIKLSDESSMAARSFVKQPGEIWCSGFNPTSYPKALCAFKKSGWRPCQFVAAWAPQSDEPWLLITNLPATKQRLLDYASRWCVERTFLAWKSHGWDIESLQIDSPEHLGRYLVGIALATIWTLVCAVAHTTKLIQDRLTSGQQPRQAVVQLRLPFGEPEPDRRPWLAKFSLLTWGRHVLHQAPCRASTPPLCWRLPDWHAPVWSVHSKQLLVPNP